MRLLPSLLLLLASAAAAVAQPPAQAAGDGPVTLRPFAVVDDPVIRLGDLFEGGGATPQAMRAALGAAPAPGRRIVVEMPQLLAIARRHGLAWRPLGAEERVVVERPGRQIPREEIAALIHAELVRHGMDPEAELDLPGYAPPMVPPAAFLRLAVEGAAFDPATARFAVTLAVAAEEMPTLRQRVAGRAMRTFSAMTMRARVFSPIAPMWRGEGPMKVRPMAAVRAANASFSERKP